MALIAYIVGALADLMPHRFCTLATGVCVVEHMLPARTKWKDIRSKLNEVLLILNQ